MKAYLAWGQNIYVKDPLLVWPTFISNQFVIIIYLLYQTKTFRFGPKLKNGWIKEQPPSTNYMESVSM